MYWSFDRHFSQSKIWKLHQQTSTYSVILVLQPCPLEIVFKLYINKLYSQLCCGDKCNRNVRQCYCEWRKRYTFMYCTAGLYAGNKSTLAKFRKRSWSWFNTERSLPFLKNMWHNVLINIQPKPQSVTVLTVSKHNHRKVQY